MSKSLITQNWYKSLIDDCDGIITESVFTSRWALVEGYHMLGSRILQDNENFEREKIYGKKIVSHLSQSLGKSKQTIYRAIQFVKKYPDIQKLPLGKNISWHKICNKYLPDGKRKEPQFRHTCPACGHQW